MGAGYDDTAIGRCTIHNTGGVDLVVTVFSAAVSGSVAYSEWFPSLPQTIVPNGTLDIEFVAERDYPESPPGGSDGYSIHNTTFTITTD